MTSGNFMDAPQQLRIFIMSQAERRLADQNSFAAAADARAATITSAASALAAASAGLLGVALSGDLNWPMAAGAIVGVIGFTTSAHHALRSARCLQFHPAGYVPSNFVDDIAVKKTRREIDDEILEDLEERLSFNSTILKERGGIIDEAMKRLWTTPLYALLAVALTAASVAISPAA